MSAPAVIKATFADWRTIKGRKQLQLHFEIPIELQADVLTYLGAPDPTNPKWCAIALLDMSKVDKPASEPKERRRFDDLPPSQQAALLCKEPLFWAYMRESLQYAVHDENDAAETVRQHCRVKSRSEIDRSNGGWSFIRNGYQAWKTVG